MFQSAKSSKSTKTAKLDNWLHYRDSPTRFSTSSFFPLIIQACPGPRQWVKIFSILVKISLSSPNFRFEKNWFPIVLLFTPGRFGKVQITRQNLNQIRKYFNPLVSSPGRLEWWQKWGSKISLDCPFKQLNRYWCKSNLKNIFCISLINIRWDGSLMSCPDNLALLI